MFQLELRVSFKKLSVTLLTEAVADISSSASQVLLCAAWCLSLWLPGELSQHTSPVCHAVLRTGKAILSYSFGWLHPAPLVKKKGEELSQGHSWQGTAGMSSWDGDPVCCCRVLALAPTPPPWPAKTISAIILISQGASAVCFSFRCFKCQTCDTMKYHKVRLDKRK